MVSNQQIEGRGGAAFTFTGSAGFSHEFLLVAGASRDQQFDDFWKVQVTTTKEGLKVTQQKLDVKERDGFSARNGMTAVAWQKSVFMFGGQDSERDVVFDDLWVFENGQIKQVDFGVDAQVPK